jgi:hypothetical protein
MLTLYLPQDHFWRTKEMYTRSNVTFNFETLDDLEFQFFHLIMTAFNSTTRLSEALDKVIPFVEAKLGKIIIVMLTTEVRNGLR